MAAAASLMDDSTEYIHDQGFCDQDFYCGVSNLFLQFTENYEEILPRAVSAEKNRREKSGSPLAAV